MIKHHEKINTGKVIIGLRHIPLQQRIIQGDMVTLQTALLEKRKPGHWLLELIWRWL